MKFSEIRQDAPGQAALHFAETVDPAAMGLTRQQLDRLVETMREKRRADAAGRNAAQEMTFRDGRGIDGSKPVLAVPSDRELSDWRWILSDGMVADNPRFVAALTAHDPYRIPSESADAIGPCLEQTTGRFGQPRRVLHDLSEAMAAACQQAWEIVPRNVCHLHLLRDIGEDLYATPRGRLRDRVRQLKLQGRLKDQRKAQTAWLREHLGWTIRM